MPGVDGIELAGEINRIAPECKIVFVSSYIFYAPDVYNTEHIYFVLKSQMDERLPMALEKAVASISKPRDFMLIKAGASAMRIPTDTVMYLERALHKTKVVTASESYMTTQSPAELLKNVEYKNAFIHCHQKQFRSFIRPPLHHVRCTGFIGRKTYLFNTHCLFCLIIFYTSEFVSVIHSWSP